MSNPKGFGVAVGRADTAAHHTSPTNPVSRFRPNVIDPKRPLDPALGKLYDLQKKYVDAGGEAVFGRVHGNPRALATWWECDNGYLVHDAKAPGGVFAVHGAIFQRYRALGGPRSYLGQPITDEGPFDGGRASSFQHGGIYWWPDAGDAIDLRGVRVAYTGLYCEDETDPEPLGDDEPYVVIGWIANATHDGASGSVSTAVYGGFSDGSSRADTVPFYDGPPFGISIDAAVFEHDHGDPNRYRSDVETIVRKHHELGVKALGVIPFVGHELATYLGPELEKLIPVWTDLINDALGTADDRIGSRRIDLSPRDMVLLAARETDREWGPIRYKFETGNLSGQGGTYNAYFTIAPA